MRLTTRLIVSAALSLFAMATASVAGGFYLSLEKPDKVDGTQNEAVLTVRAFGCHQPENAQISATAEGLVKGQRKTIQLRLQTTSKGVYAIQQQWPKEGVWLVAVRGNYLGDRRGVLLELAPEGAVEIGRASGKTRVKTLSCELTAIDIENGLQELASKQLSLVSGR